MRKRLDDQESGGTFDFTATNTDLTNFDLTASGTQVSVIDGFILDAGQDFTIAEDVPSGWINTDINCRNLTTVTNRNIAPNTEGPAQSSHTLTEDFYAPGDSIRCTFRNLHKETLLTVEKEWGNITGAVSVDITASAAGSGSQTQTASTSASTVQTPISNFKVFAGETVTLSEDVLPSFTQNLVCDTVSPTGETTATFDVPADPPASITCRFINIEYPNLNS